ncbi:MAG: CAP domain-containing protein [Anaerolineae bacterium]
MRRLGLFMAMWGMLAVLAIGAVSAQQPTNDTFEARWIHAQLNNWRLGLDLGPLAPNETLNRMAYDQATYLASLPQLPGSTAIHNGRTGEGPRVRALWPEYNWPNYGSPGQILLSEITWVGDRQDALDFWHESRIHRESATNPWYREVGVAAVPYARNGIKGHIYVAVLGARPNVLPALADPRQGTLYLTNEIYRGARAQTIRNVHQVRLFDGDGRPLTNGWIPWAAELPIPANAGTAVNVLYSDGERQAMTNASLNEGDVMLPAYEDVWRVKSAALILPTAAPTPTPTPTPPPHIRIIYDRYGLNLLNTSPTPADVRRLRLVGANGGEVRVSDLTAGFVRGSLRALPAYSCLVYGVNSTRRDLPDECRYSSVTFAQFRDLFWTQGDFTVYRDDVALTTCLKDDGICEFDLP